MTQEMEFERTGILLENATLRNNAGEEFLVTMEVMLPKAKVPKKRTRGDKPDLSNHPARQPKPYEFIGYYRTKAGITLKRGDRLTWTTGTCMEVVSSRSGQLKYKCLSTERVFTPDVMACDFQNWSVWRIP